MSNYSEAFVMSKKKFIKPVLVGSEVKDLTTFKELEVGDTFFLSSASGNTYMKLYCEGLSNSVRITSCNRQEGRFASIEPSLTVHPTKIEVTLL